MLNFSLKHVDLYLRLGYLKIITSSRGEKVTGKGGKERGEKRKEKGKGREREDQARQGCKCLFDLLSMTFIP